ncbi:MAG: DUF4364 family protein [Clostridium sp.]|nr:DUF4364 family protein [Clostridium sp.]MCM1547195.1 DUF4364 family protein [Ruminococcus sp.]
MDENTTKMSELASMEIKDIQTVKILICYLLYRINKPVESEQLYDIAVTTGIINYFMYQEAIDYLIKNDSVSAEIQENSSKIYTLTEKGVSCARTLREYAPKSYRDKIVQAALRYFAKIKYENEVKIEYIELKKGYYVHCRCLDVGDDLLDLKLFAPDKTQAEMIGRNIMLDPAGFYSRILNIALNNKEEEFDPDEL